MEDDDAKRVLQQHLDWANGKNCPGVGRAELNAAIEAVGKKQNFPVGNVMRDLEQGGFSDPAFLIQIKFLACG